MLQGKHITFSYSDSAKGKIDVLKDVSFEIREHDFIGLIGKRITDRVKISNCRYLKRQELYHQDSDDNGNQGTRNLFEDHR